MKNSIQYIEQLVNESRYLEAQDSIDNHFSSELENAARERLEQLKALSLSKMGDPTMAMEFFEPRWRSHANSSESAGIMGSIYKAIFIDTEDPKYGKLSANTYLESFNTSTSYYTGINAATMSRIVGNSSGAKTIARQIEEILLPLERDYWQEATIAECYLLLREPSKATEHFIRTREMMSNNWGTINSVRQQLWLLNHYTPVPRAILDFFKPPKITAFIGHMIDAPDREKPRFAPEMEDNVRAAIRSSILTYDIQIGYSSLACGSDIIFVEEMLDLGRNVELLFPFNISDFIQTSVAFAGDHWVERFQAVLEKQLITHYLIDQPFSGDDHQFHLLALQISGLAMLKAKQMKSEAYLLAVISEFDLEAKTGGVRDLINFWQDKDKVHRVNIDPLKSSGNSPLIASEYENLEERNYDTNGILAFSICLQFDEEDELIEVITKDRKPVALERFDNKTIIVFNGLPAVIGFITDFFQQISNVRYKGSIVLGNLSANQENVLHSALVKQSISLIDTELNNALLLNESLATLMMTSLSNITLQYIGMMEPSEGEKETIYRMSQALT